MDEEKIKSEYATFQEENPGFGNMVVLNRDGEVLFRLDPNFISDGDGKILMDAWVNRKPAIEWTPKRYPIFSWEDLQFAARNIKDKDSLVGCITKSKNYIVVHMATGSKPAPAIATITLNRWSWDKF